MIAVARSISHGEAYSEYAERKDKAIFVGADNMITNTDIIFNDKDQIEELWEEFEDAKLNYVRKGKDVDRDAIAIEFSPTTNESEGWTREQWFAKAKELLEEMDKRQLEHPKWDNKKKDWVHDANGKRKMFPIPQTKLSQSRWMTMLHRDSASGIFHLHILISRFNNDNELNCDTDIAKRAAQAAEEMNRKYGYPSAMEIHDKHVQEIQNVLNDILFDMDDDNIDVDEVQRRVKEATYTDYKGNIQHYDMKYQKDDNDNVKGYIIMRGNSKFTGKEIGFRLANIEDEQKTIIKDAIYDSLREMKTSVFSWSEFGEVMEFNHNCLVTPKFDSNGNVVNYTITRGKKKYNPSEIGAHVTAKKLPEEWKKEKTKQRERSKQSISNDKPSATRPSRWSKEGKALREREAAQRVQKERSFVPKAEPTHGQKDRQETITFTKDSIRSWLHTPSQNIDNRIKEVVGNGAAAHCIEHGNSPFIAVNLEAAVQELTEGLNLNSHQVSQLMDAAAGALVDMVIPPNVPVSGGGGGNNDLPKQKDDWWDKWKNAFGNKLASSRKKNNKPHR